MHRTAILFATLFSLIIATVHAGSGNENPADEQLIEQAKRIHDRIVTLDTHVDFEAALATPEHNPGMLLENHKVDLVKMREGGLDGVFFAVWVGQRELTDENFREAYEGAMAKFNAIHRMCVAYNADKVELAISPDDVRRIKQTGRRIALIGIENGFCVGEDIANLRYFYDLGARYMTITHIGYNQLGDSSDKRKNMPDRKYGGLSEFGREVVREMNRLGMMVDVSHVSRETFYDIVEISRAPVIASHSGCRAVCDVPRNLDDNQLRALKQNGGTIQIVGYGGYLKTPGKDATITDFVDHIDYAVVLIGIDHVGIGSDFDGGGGVPGFNDPSDCMNVTVELLRRGYSEEDIEKIWGGNLLRVWSEVIAVSRKLGK